MNAAYCYRPSSVVCRSVGVLQSWACKKRLEWSRCRLGYGLTWAPPREARIRWGVNIGATWRIRLNRSCAAALCQITLTTCLIFHKSRARQSYEPSCCRPLVSLSAALHVHLVTLSTYRRYTNNCIYLSIYLMCIAQAVPAHYSEGLIFPGSTIPRWWLELGLGLVGLGLGLKLVGLGRDGTGPGFLTRWPDPTRRLLTR